MIDNAIVTRAHIEQKAISAFARGVKRHEHGFNWHAAALPVWLAAWDKCAEFAESVADSRSAP